jgi:dTDP-4-amino-4,6-dideoxygalactose transaminase
MHDLRAHHATLGPEIAQALARVCESQQFILGPEVEKLETDAASWLGARFAIGVSSGTDALLCALLALGIGPGDEVITTPFTFVSTVEAIVRAGATPRFVDIRLDTFNIDPEQIPAVLTARTRAVVPVHLFGQPADLTSIIAHAERVGALVIEDAAQAFGAKHRGRSAGTWGAAGCFSFFPTKVLGALGDAGLIATNDRALATRCRQIRAHGASSKHVYELVGGNFRLDALQAAVLSTKLPRVLSWIEARKEHADAYDRELSRLPGLVVTSTIDGADHAHALYTLRVLGGRRTHLANYLRERGVETAVHYPQPLHLQAPFAALARPDAGLPNSERAAREVLSLPLYAELAPEQRAHVIHCVKRFFAS